MKKTITYPYGSLIFYDHYCHLDLNENAHLTIENCKDIITDIDSFYKKNKHVVISDRKFTASVDPEAYRHVDYKRMVGIAVVTSSETAKKDLIKEQELYKGSFAFFKTVQQAKDWAGTFVESYA